MFTVIDVAADAALDVQGEPWGDPVLFDTEAEAQAWAVGLLGEDGVKDLRIDRV